ncbi:MAG: hypothetical protein AAGE52_18405 [Myxococcota bacterium]
MKSVEDHVRKIQEEGYTVLPSLYNAEEIELLRAELSTLWEENGRLPLYQDDCGYVAENIEIWGLGLVFHKLLRFKPHLAGHLLKTETAAVLRGLFPEGAYVEKTGAVLSDSTRPFFQWHTHVGGIDDELYRKHGWEPQFDRAQRVVVIIYLNDIEPDGGQVLIWPRRESDPNAKPPFETTNLAWEGQVELTAPRGSVLILEQCTWHAALVRKMPGVRMFIGAYYASVDAPATFDVDESLLSLGEQTGALHEFQPSEERTRAAQGLPPEFASAFHAPVPAVDRVTTLLEGVPEAHGARIVESLRNEGRATFRFVTEDGRSFDLVLVPRDPKRAALRRSKSFNVLYDNVIGEPNDALRTLVRAAVEAVCDRDPGGLTV